MAKKAIKQRWPMTPEIRAEVVAKLRAFVADPDSGRAAVNAAKALIDADKLNLEQEKRDLGIADKVDVTSGGQPLTQILQATRDFDPDSA